MSSLALEVAAPPALNPVWLSPSASDRNRRAHERLMVHEIDWLKSIKLKFGPSLSLIDLSAGGALFETSAPLRPGSTSSLVITGRGVVETATFRVLRCQVAGLDGGLVYRGACVFERAIQIPDQRTAHWGTNTRAADATTRASES